MAPNETASAYKAGFLGRVKAARAARFASQEDICAVLGIKQPTYGKYEVRSLMPHQLMGRFCLACGVSEEWLISAKGVGPKWEPVYPQPKPRKKPAKVKRAA